MHPTLAGDVEASKVQLNAPTLVPAVIIFCVWCLDTSMKQGVPGEQAGWPL